MFYFHSISSIGKQQNNNICKAIEHDYNLTLILRPNSGVDQKNLIAILTAISTPTRFSYGPFD